MSGKAIRETLAALGVIASMVFVGLEIRQNTTVARAATRQALTETATAWAMAMATDPDLLALYDTRFNPTSALAPGDHRAGYAMVTNLWTLENVFLQVREGIADESLFASYGWRGRTEFRTPEFRDWWAGVRLRFQPDFVAAFEAEYDLAP